MGATTLPAPLTSLPNDDGFTALPTFLVIVSVVLVNGFTFFGALSMRPVSSAPFLIICLITLGFDFFLTKSGRKGYDACKNAGEGLFGFRRKRDKEGNIIGTQPPKGAKCMKPNLVNLLITILCPPLGLFLKMGVCSLKAHSHQSSSHTEKKADGKFIQCYSIGCLADLSPDYAPINKYNHGFAVVDVNKGNDFNVTNLRIINDTIYNS